MKGTSKFKKAQKFSKKSRTKNSTRKGNRYLQSSVNRTNLGYTVISVSVARVCGKGNGLALQYSGGICRRAGYGNAHHGHAKSSRKECRGSDEWHFGISSDWAVNIFSSSHDILPLAQRYSIHCRLSHIGHPHNVFLD